MLDNAVYTSLLGPHRAFAAGDERAVRYRAEVSVFHGAPDDTPESWDALARNAGPDRTVVVLRAIPVNPPERWAAGFVGSGHQMVLDAPPADVEVPERDPLTGEPVELRDLGDDDVPAMLELVATTRPGPFSPRTIELGGYVGVVVGGALVAMAGERLHPPGWAEISAVCTHPDAQRRGWASLLTSLVASRIAARGEQVLLHVADSNHGARAAYERLGFRVRAEVTFGAFRVPDES